MFYEESKSHQNNHISEHNAEESMVYKAATEDLYKFESQQKKCKNFSFNAQNE